MSSSKGGITYNPPRADAWIPQNNFEATTNPGVTDDTDAGYSVGSMWINVTTNEIFQAVDVTGSAAIWDKLDTKTHVTTSDPGINDDETTGHYQGEFWLNTTTNELYICVDASDGAASWVEVAVGGGTVHVKNVPPTVNDDSTGGYDIGEFWWDVTNRLLYIAQSVAVGAAVWVKQTNLAELYPYLVGSVDLAPYQTIQSAINAASAGSTVWVLPGTYAETLSFKNGVDVKSVQQDLPMEPGKLTPTVIINGAATWATTGFETLNLYGLRINAPSGSAALTVSTAGGSLPFLQLGSCQLTGDDAPALSLGTTGLGMAIDVFDCTLSRTYTAAAGAPIVASHTSHVLTIKRSQINGPSGVPGIRTAVDISGGATISIRDCMSGNNRITGQIAISGGAANEVTLENLAIIPDAGDAHIDVTGTLDLTVSHWYNVVDDTSPNQGGDITLSGANAATFKENPTGNANDIRQYNGGQWQTVAFLNASPARTQKIYVAKHGNDAYDGLAPDRPKLTIAAAFTAAGTPASAAVAVTIEVMDNGTYIEDLTGVAWVNLHAPYARLVGKHALVGNMSWEVDYAEATSPTGFRMDEAGALSYLKIRHLYVNQPVGGVFVNEGGVNLHVDEVTMTDSGSWRTAVFWADTTADDSYIHIGHVALDGDGVGVAIGGGTVEGWVGSIEGGAGTTGLSVHNSTARLVVGKINCAESMLVNGASSDLYLVCSEITGTQTWSAGKLRVAAAKNDRWTQSAPPGVDDDLDKGHQIGDFWWDATNRDFFIAQAVGDGAAVWDNLFNATTGGTISGNVLLPTTTEIQFRDGNSVIRSDGANRLDLYGTNIDLNGIVQVTSTLNAAGQVNALGGTLYVGVDDDTRGIATLYGDSANLGGELRIHTGANRDTTTEYFAIGIVGSTDDLFIGADGASQFVLTTEGNVGIDTTTVPHGGVGAAKLAIEGTNASTAGPHVQFTTASDDYPLMQFLPWSHDIVYLTFDAYFDGASWKSSDPTSNFVLGKQSDVLYFGADGAVAAGSAIGLVHAFDIDANAEVLFSPSAARKLYFRDAALSISSSSDSILQYDADGSHLFNTGNVIIAGTGALGFGGGTDEYIFSQSIGILDFVARGPLYYWADSNANDGATALSHRWHVQEAPSGSGTPVMTLNNAGNLAVGLGTVAPDARFVVANSDDAQLLIEELTETSGDVAGLYFKSATADTNYKKAAVIFENDGTGNGLGDLHLCLNNVASSANVTKANAVMTLTHEGGVGINTASPLDKLDVRGADGMRLRLQETSGAANTTTGILFKTSTDATDANYKGAIIWEDDGTVNARGLLHFAVNGVNDGSNATVAEAVMSILATGVGIGTTTVPHGGIGTAKLAIEGDNASTAGPHVQFTTASDDYPIFAIRPWAHDNATIMFDAYDDAGTLKSSDAGSNFRLGKYTDALNFDADVSIAAGSAVTFLTAFRVNADATVTFAPSSDRPVYWRDSAIHIRSLDDGHLDLTADVSVDINSPDLAMIGTNPDLLVQANSATGISTLYLQSTGDVGALLRADLNADQCLFAPSANVGRQVVLTDYANIAVDHGFATQTNPTLYGFSANSAATNPNEWWSITHNQTDTVFTLGQGDFVLTCPANKTLELTEAVYDDIQFAVAEGRVGASNAPTWSTFTTNTSEYQFAVDDYIDLSANEMAHWWEEGTTVDVHLHVTLDAGNATGSDRFAKFTIYFAYADSGDTWTETSLTAELTIPDGSSALKAFYLDLGNVDLSGKTLGTQIKARIKRITATGGTEYADEIFITQLGVHAKKDTMGSRQETVK